uniref:ParB/Sulfiredoxin domain-containing protein n=1 Tax=Prevotella sp. GTC17262 TaxID=3236797 RepID=A0AB33JIK2_9BACT
MEQEIQNLKIADLVLWTENPRDPIDSNAKDQDVVNMAMNDRSGLWQLQKLADQMGDYYDFSELPIVVYEDKKPVVYDGNRRVILAKISKGLVTTKTIIKNLPSIPDEIPCNVCKKDIAINSILRKHGTKGSWRPLYRDQFIMKYKNNGKKSDFLIIDEATGIISTHHKMNQGFVRDEVFTPSNLEKLGLRINNGKLESKHSMDVLNEILSDLCDKIERNFLSTRQSRGDVFGILNDSTKHLISEDEKNHFIEIANSETKTEGQKQDTDTTSNSTQDKRRTRRTKNTEQILFGKQLSLKAGDVNNLYRDICDLNDYYNINLSRLTRSFVTLIRMSLRLLCETASSECGYKDIAGYCGRYFDDAKKTLTSDEATLLSTQNVSKGSLIPLLHIGAHNYTASQNYEQTKAVSIILGAMLQFSHNHK